jgi:TPR repeat protein
VKTILKSLLGLLGLLGGASLLACKGGGASRERAPGPCFDTDPLELCEARCRDGSADSCRTLWKRLYETSEGDPERAERAVDLLASQCHAGRVNRCSAAAELLLGRTIIASLDEAQGRALELLEHGCDSGSVSSCETLSEWYRDGRHGVPEDFQRYLALSRRACDLEPIAYEPGESESGDGFFINELVAGTMACGHIEVYEDVQRERRRER